MKIKQITSNVIGSDYIGMWYCADSITPMTGEDKDPVIRYLKHDGTWGLTTDYFDDEDQIQAALDKGHKPDFNMSRREREDRAMIRQDLDEMMEEDLDSFWEGI